jgi:hypothetical protein
VNRGRGYKDATNRQRRTSERGRLNRHPPNRRAPAAPAPEAAPVLRPSGGARVVSLSSSAHLYCPVLSDDPAFAFVPYSRSSAAVNPTPIIPVASNRSVLC